MMDRWSDMMNGPNKLFSEDTKCNVYFCFVVKILIIGVAKGCQDREDYNSQ